MMMHTSLVPRHNHKYQIRTYLSPTYCDVCTQFIWGVIKQGFHCPECGVNVHKKCMIMESCETTASLSSESVAPPSLRSVTSETKKLQRKRKEGQHPLPLKQQQQQEKQINDIEQSLLDQVLQMTAVHSVNAEKTVNAMRPELHLFTNAPKHFIRFVQRVGPLFWLQDQLLDIILWRHPWVTLAFYFLYSLLCFFPSLLIILPHLGFFYLLLHLHYKKQKEKVKHPDKKRFVFQLDEDARLAQNLRHLQNFTMNYSDAYDSLESLLNQLYSMNSSQRSLAFRLWCFSLVGGMIVFAMAPLNLLFFALGTLFFLGNSPFIKALGQVLLSRFEKWPIENAFLYNAVFPFLRFILIHDCSANSSGPFPFKRVASSKRIVVFENQRWWPGLGFLPLLFKQERPPWSDESGKKPLHKKAIQDTPAIHWESEWTVEINPTETDENGWTYSDFIWCNPQSSFSYFSYTRRRKWIRTFTPIKQA